VPAQLELPVQIVDRSNWAGWDKPYEQRALFKLNNIWRS
jgi:hypothetical protein